MGMMKINTTGSFQPALDKEFSAMKHGHASAVAEAIEWLSSEVLPLAIEQDHALHSEDAFPEEGFGRGPRKESESD